MPTLQGMKVIDENTILVNLNAIPDLVLREGWPMPTKPEEHWVEVQKRTDGLYLGNQKLILRFSEGCAGQYPFQGYELYLDWDRSRVDNINIAYMFLEHPSMFPKEWEDSWLDRKIWFSVGFGRGYRGGTWYALRGISRKDSLWEVSHFYKDGRESVGLIQGYPPHDEKVSYCPANIPELLSA